LIGFYPELRRVAGALLKNERAVSLSAGDLVQETVLRLIQLRQIRIDDRAHFMCLASRFMRRILVDHVRAKRAEKREHQRVTLITGVEPGRAFDLNGLEHALLRLGSFDGERAEIVEMRYFGGMTLGDIAQVLSLSEATVKRRWTSARVWLLEAMDDPFVPARLEA
jgi:RNA polymerase sigma factor (TIGR02999 family)